MTWAAQSPRRRQKTGAWTRKKLRRKRIAEAAARGEQRAPRHEPVDRSPHGYGRI